ncbi:hypothetical protein KSP39_PZI019654 [Platanthera zijinensis]|uniref:Terpene synthase N-terminal domain-containing protein n=1 Tax=Platanthera zijinensis TaxID=2320716 RepID=A0AAP0FY14_9ASPA
MATTSDPARRSGNYHPTIWDDSYVPTLSVGFTEEDCLIRRDKLKEEVRHLIGEERALVEQLELLDNLRQLGLSYHFELEIKAPFVGTYFHRSSGYDRMNRTLINVRFMRLRSGSCGRNRLTGENKPPQTKAKDAKRSINSVKNINNELGNNLHGTALLFRLLLREHGLYASQLCLDLVNNFKSEKINYNMNLEHDVKGMLSLYEASYLAVDGEDALDETGEFAANFLYKATEGSSVNNIPDQLIKQIDHALELPLHWRMPRLHTRWYYIDAYVTQDNSMDPILIELAKLDFNIVQSIYKMNSRKCLGGGKILELFVISLVLQEIGWWSIAYGPWDFVLSQSIGNSGKAPPR